jgi:hypothetical protein
MSDQKQKPMDDAEIMSRVNSKVKESVSWYDSRLSLERQRVINYYNSVLPKRQHMGSSPYISTDVYDSVESMKAQLIETFSANPDNLISFPPNGPKDVEAAKQATEYCNFVFFSENDGFNIMSDVAHDGLTARTGVCKLYWDKRTKDIEEEIPAGASYQDVQGLAAQSEVTELDADADPNSPNPQNPTFKGTLTRSYDCSQVCVETVPPEEFLISPRAYSIALADVCSHRTLKSKGELIRMGYPKDKVMELHYDDDKGLDLGPEVLARNMPVETAQALDNPIQDELEKVMLYETYVRLDLHNGKGVKLYKICHVNEVMLEKPQEVDSANFYSFAPLPIPYMFYGNNFAARVIPTQNARTVLTRSILDHAAITTNPRWGVVKGGLLNPKEMIENRLGGLVNMTRPDALQPIAQQNLNPFVFQTIEMLKQNKEESTGISSLSQGLNKDAISTQNSAALVDNLVTLSQTRQKIIARNFAKFLSELYVGIYKLVLENQDKEKKKIIEVAGNFVPMSTYDWIERTTCKVALHLGYGERDRETAKFQALYKELASDPALGPVFDLPHRVKLATDAMKSGGFQNFAEYLGDPSKVQPPQPDPIKMAELKVRQTEADAAMLTAQTGAKAADNHIQVSQMKEQLSELGLHLKAILGMRDEARKDRDVDNRIDVAQRETEMLEKQPISKETGVVAPH